MPLLNEEALPLAQPSKVEILRRSLEVVTNPLQCHWLACHRYPLDKRKEQLIPDVPIARTVLAHRVPHQLEVSAETSRQTRKLKTGRISAREVVEYKRQIHEVALAQSTEGLDQV